MPLIGKLCKLPEPEPDVRAPVEIRVTLPSHELWHLFGVDMDQIDAVGIRVRQSLIGRFLVRRTVIGEIVENERDARGLKRANAGAPGLAEAFFGCEVTGHVHPEQRLRLIKVIHDCHAMSALQELLYKVAPRASAQQANDASSRNHSGQVSLSS